MLSPGVRLGVYKIVSSLGVGGMGEVYLANDTRLGRRVALKVLASSLADDGDRRRRLALFATTATLHGAELLHIMLDGRALLLRQFQSQELFTPRPSPDGRSLLVGIQQNSSNVWMLER